MVAEVVGFEGETRWDTSKPDGTPQKLLDVSKLAEEGWTSKIGLREGIASTVELVPRARRGACGSSAAASPDADYAWEGGQAWRTDRVRRAGRVPSDAATKSASPG